MTGDEEWTGGHYELLFDVGGGRPAPGRVAELAAALWSHPCLDGPYPWPDPGPDRQACSAPGTERCRGTATLPDGHAVACGSLPASSIPGFLPDGEPHPSDLLEFVLPLGSLGRAWPRIGGYPFEPDQDTRPWQEPLEDWLAGIAAHTSALVPFRLAVIGFELDPDHDLWRSWARGTVPAERRVGLLLPAGDGVEYLRRTAWM